MNKDEFQYLAVSAGKKFAESYHYDTKKMAVAAAYNIIINPDVIDGQELKDYLNEGKISESLKNVFTKTSGQFQGDEREERVRFRSDETETGKQKEKIIMNAEREKLCLQRY